MTKKIEVLIAKYFSDKLSKKEAQELVVWIQTNKNKDIFDKYIALNFTLEKLKSNLRDTSQLWEYIEHNCYNKPARTINYWKYAVASSIVLLISLTFIFNKLNNTVIDTPIIVNDHVVPGTYKATLTLEDGTDIVLEEGESYVADNLSSNGEELVYDTSKETETEVAYNYLTIPRGGEHRLKLSDGTQVWLNSETKLKYPKSFVTGETREVELVYGEAYFDVSPSTNHNGVKFKVVHNMQEVEVLGTEFNIKAYKDEMKVYTTLVEGKVQVASGTSNVLLKPEEQSIVQNSKIVEVLAADVYNETAWKEGMFGFKRKSLKEIMKVLERWYDFETVFNDATVENIPFTGNLSREINITEILTIIKNFNLIKSFEIKGNTITIN